ncbi:ABC transporter permease [Brevibacillus sp. GCM10020057]|uniref:ABC transporter permease n=1 Tax=Brevibacillus sp. GCM10020057 TaxID=3317327 RepID=UPI003635D3BF
MDVDALFRQRLQRFMAEVVRYGQYMANGGVLMVAVFLCGLLAYYYPSLVRSIPESFPLAYALAAVFAVFVTRSPHRTFLQEADLLFLTPAETKMARYFQKAQVYNFAVQSIGLFLVLLLCAPLYTVVPSADGVQRWLYWTVPFVLKGWNVHASWLAMRLPDKRRRAAYALGRFGFTFFLLAWMLGEGSSLAYRHIPYGAVAWMALLVWFHLRLQKIGNRHAYKWYQLLEMEDGLRQRFYQIANQFRDVPSLQRQVKARRWLVWVVRLIPYRPTNAARILYLTLFLRSSDLAGMYFRLVAISALLILLMPGMWAKAAVVVLFLFMSASQLKGVGSQSRHRARASLLPLGQQQQKHAAIWVRRVLLLTQAAVSVLASLV